MSPKVPENLPCPTGRELDDFVNGRVGRGRLFDIELHLQDCPRCQGQLGSVAPDLLVKKLEQFEFREETCESSAETSFAKPFELGTDSRYELMALLGEGGMGQVFRARHKVMKRTVAIKTIRPELINHPEAVRRFAKETRAAARLSHPNIVSAFDAEREEDLNFLVMEYVEGEGLNRIVNRNGPLDSATATDYIRQAALGLQHAFEQGMVHRDIKPHNLMLTSDGVVKILDFGLAKFRQEATESGEPDSVLDETVLTLNDTRLGTEGYIAPEQAHDARTADIRSDIFSLGCTFFFLLTNRAPFFGLPGDESESKPDVSRFRQDLPSQTCQVLAGMMAHDPDARFQSPAEVVAAIDAVHSPMPEASLAISGSNTGSGTRNPHTEIRRWPIWLIGGGLALLAVGWGIYQLFFSN